MANRLTESFGSGTDGANLTTSNTSATSVYPTSGTKPKVSTTWAADGTRSALISCSGTSQSLIWDITSSATLIVEGFINLESIGSTAYLANVLASGANEAQIRILSDRTVQIRGGTTGTTDKGTSTLALVLGTGYRWEWHINATTQTLYIYEGNSSTPYITLTGAANSYNGTAVNQVQVGNFATATVTYRLDAVIADTTTVRGPLASPPTVTLDGPATYDTATAQPINASISGNTGTTTWQYEIDASSPSTNLSQFGDDSGTGSDADTTINPDGDPGDYKYRLAVTDDSGTTRSAWRTDTVIGVPAADESSGVYAVHLDSGWTGSANLLDGDPATRVVSPTNPTSADLGLDLRNRVAPTGDLNIVLRSPVLVGTSGSVDASIYKHNRSTLVKKVPGTAFITGDLVTITFAHDDLATMGTDWATTDGWGGYLLLEATAS